MATHPESDLEYWEMVDRDLKEAEKLLEHGSTRAAVITAMIAVEKSLRIALGVGDLKQAELLDLMHFAKRENVWLPAWKELKKWRYIRNMCLHAFYTPTRREAEKAIEFARFFTEKAKGMNVAEKVKRKAKKHFRKLEGSYRKTIMLTDRIFIAGALIFLAGWLMLLHLTLTMPHPALPWKLRFLFSMAAIPAGLGACILSLLEKWERKAPEA